MDAVSPITIERKAAPRDTQRGRVSPRPHREPSYTSTVKTLLAEQDCGGADSVVFYISVRCPDVIIIASASCFDARQMPQSTAAGSVLLDLTSTDLCGLQVLRELRGSSDTPLIIIAANAREIQRRASSEPDVTGYRVRSFSKIELVDSVNAALGHRKSGDRRDATHSLSDMGGVLVIDLVGQRILRERVELKITPAEDRLLSALLQNQGRTLPWSELAGVGWGAGTMASPARRLDLCRLQLKLGDNPRQPALLMAGVEGYSLALFR